MRPGRPVTIGRPIGNTAIHVLDPTGEPTPMYANAVQRAEEIDEGARLAASALRSRVHGSAEALAADLESLPGDCWQREVVTASRRAFELAEQQLKVGTADIVTVLNTQLTLFQAEDSLWQAELARLLAYVSLYQALGGGWEPRIERPANAL